MRNTMSSAWSHGTFCRRSVTRPLTESDTTMFWPLVSASSCSSGRTSMSWKLSVSRSPVKTLSLSMTAAVARGRWRTSTTYWLSVW